MEGTIYLVGNGDELTEMRQQPYDSESVLQALLAKYPDLLAGDQMTLDEPRRWLLIDREVGIPATEDAGDRWSVDHLFIDQDGIPTIVEVKRSSNTQIRREVIGQMLDYAANAVVYWPVESLRARFEERCNVDEREPEVALADLLGGDTDADAFWAKVKTNLQAGKVRLVLVADEIPAECRRVIEFLSTQMDPGEVLGVEIKQYVGAHLKTLVPRVFGQKTKEPPQSKQWNEESFFNALANKRPGQQAEIRAARELLRWAQQRRLHIWWGKGRQDGSFFPMFQHAGTWHWLFSVWTYARVSIQFGMMKSKPPFDDEDMRRELLRRLNAISDVRILEDAIGFYPSIPLSALTKGEAVKEFLETFDWVIEQITSAGAGEERNL